MQVTVCAELSNAAQAEITYSLQHTADSAVQGINIKWCAFFHHCLYECRRVWWGRGIAICYDSNTLFVSGSSALRYLQIHLFFFPGEDYVADSIPASITFGPSITRLCFNVTIVNDGITERQEQFSISFQRAGRGSADATAQIVIVDDDGMVINLFQLTRVVISDYFII